MEKYGYDKLNEPWIRQIALDAANLVKLPDPEAAAQRCIEECRALSPALKDDWRNIDDVINRVIKDVSLGRPPAESAKAEEDITPTSLRDMLTARNIPIPPGDLRTSTWRERAKTALSEWKSDEQADSPRVD